jgi:hypothetical protein
MNAGRRRLAIYAHYDKKNRIEKYVKYYIDGLQRANCDVVFVSDCILDDGEKNKIKNSVLRIICDRHNEYDFGSYKRGFLYVKENGLIEDYDELVFCNDSCYAPIYPFAEMFGVMEGRRCDFWGVTYSRCGFRKVNGLLVDAEVPHLQSYFVVFSREIAGSEVFKDFILGVKEEKDKTDVILKYELELTSLLQRHGFTFSYYIPEFINFTTTCSIFEKWHELIFRFRCPFLKYQAISLYKADFSVLRKLYPIKYISENIINRFGIQQYLNMIDSPLVLLPKLVSRIKTSMITAVRRR